MSYGSDHASYGFNHVSHGFPARKRQPPGEFLDDARRLVGAFGEGSRGRAKIHEGSARWRGVSATATIPPYLVGCAPPLTPRVCPVMCRAPAEARKYTVSAISTGIPARPVQVASTSCPARSAGSLSRKNSVSRM